MTKKLCSAVSQTRLMLDIALLYFTGPYTLTEVMTYTRSSAPDFSVPLSREELKVFTSVRGETSLDAVVLKTRLGSGLVTAALTNLIAKGLIVQLGKGVNSDVDGKVSAFQPQASSQTATAPKTAPSWLAQRQAVEDFLVLAMGGGKARTYVTQLQNCTDEEMFAENAQAIANRLSLIVDVGVGKKLLTLLES